MLVGLRIRHVAERFEKPLHAGIVGFWIGGVNDPIVQAAGYARDAGGAVNEL